MKQEKNVVIAYLLWWFVGFLGFHRLYTNQKRWYLYLIATLTALSTLIILVGYLILLVVFVFWIYDAFILVKAVEKANKNLTKIEE